MDSRRNHAEPSAQSLQKPDFAVVESGWLLHLNATDQPRAGVIQKLDRLHMFLRASCRTHVALHPQTLYQSLVNLVLGRRKLQYR